MSSGRRRGPTETRRERPDRFEVRDRPDELHTGATDRLLAAGGRSRNVVLSAAHFLFVPEIVARSDLIALVPARLVRRRTRDLQVFAPPIPVQGFQIAMLWHDRTHAHPGHRWLRDQLATSAAAQPAPRELDSPLS